MVVRLGKSDRCLCGDSGPLYILLVASCAIRGSGAWNLLYAMTFHFLAGAVAGSVFRLRTLLLLVVFVAIEAMVFTVVDIRAAAFWAATNIATIQVGYVAGIFGRRALEQAGYSLPPARIRWPQ
jgi:hypothetical protein